MFGDIQFILATISHQIGIQDIVALHYHLGEVTTNTWILIKSVQPEKKVNFSNGCQFQGYNNYVHIKLTAGLKCLVLESAAVEPAAQQSK